MCKCQNERLRAVALDSMGPLSLLFSELSCNKLSLPSIKKAHLDYLLLLKSFSYFIYMCVCFCFP